MHFVHRDDAFLESCFGSDGNQNVLPQAGCNQLIKAGSKNFPDTKKYWWGYARCMEKTVGAIEDTLPRQENLSGVWITFHEVLFCCQLTLFGARLDDDRVLKKAGDVWLED